MCSKPVLLHLPVILTNDERDHGGPIPSRSFETLDEFLHFPYFNVLLRLIGLWSAHIDRSQCPKCLREFGLQQLKRW